MTDTVFETRRTRVRKCRESDLTSILAVYGDRDAMQWVGDGEPISISEAQRWMQVTSDNYQKRGYGMFAVELRKSGEVAGFVGLVHPNQQHDAEIKYAYLRQYWGLGLATEVARGTIEYGRVKHELRHIIATTAPENLASHRVLLKAGMRQGDLRENDDGSRTQLFIWRL
jgi:RimJ/RimL family protein N-acetyltransferase